MRLSGGRVDLLDLLGAGGAYLFVISLYTSPAHLFPVLEVLRPAMLAATATLVAVALRRVLRAERVRGAGSVGVAMTVLFVIVAASPLWALDIGRASGFALGSVKLLAAFIGLAGTLRTPRQIRTVLVVAALASIVPAWGTIERWRGGIDLVEGFRGAWIGLLANPNQLAMLMAMTVPWTLASWERSQGPFLRAALLLAFGLQCATVVVTHSRGGSLGLATAVTAWALLSQNRGRAFGLGAAAAVAVLLFAPESFWQRNETIQDYEMDASAQGRLRSWEAGWRALGESPLLGVGADNYLAAWNRYMPRNIREHSYTAHNTWMQVTVELGLLGLAAFVAMLLATARGLWKMRDDVELGREARGMLASLLAILVCGSTGGYGFNWFFYMLLGIAGALLSQTAVRRAEAPRALAFDPG